MFHRYILAAFAFASVKLSVSERVRFSKRHSQESKVKSRDTNTAGFGCEPRLVEGATSSAWRLPVLGFKLQMTSNVDTYQMASQQNLLQLILTLICSTCI